VFLTKQFLFSQRGNRGRKVKWDRKQDALTVRLQTNEIVTIRLLRSHQSFFCLVLNVQAMHLEGMCVFYADFNLSKCIMDVKKHTSRNLTLIISFCFSKKRLKERHSHFTLSLPNCLFYQYSRLVHKCCNTFAHLDCAMCKIFKLHKSKGKE
jgi:hypothetical protein